MKTVGYYNGNIKEVSDLCVPFCDRVCFFGDGVYDACYAHNHRIFTLDEHLERLAASAKLVDVCLPMTISELTGLITSLVKICDDGDTFVYVQITRGTAPRNHVYETKDGNLWISVTPKTVTPKEKRMRLISAPDVRYSMCNIKTLNLMPNVLAAQAAYNKQCDEAVFHVNGRVTECAHSNVHLLKNDVLYTAPCDNKILAGIARKHLISACNELGITVKETPFYVDEIAMCDELIVTSAGTFCAPSEYFDGFSVGGKAQDTIAALQSTLYGEFYDATR